jgi:Holliday junction resolvase RusA-like endonuclease
VSLHLDIPGEPVGKGRPRPRRWGGYRLPKKTREYQDRIATIARARWRREAIPRDHATHVSIVAVHKRPKRLMRKRDPKERIPLTAGGGTYPDLDNVAKAVLDGLQDGGVLEDDCCVTSLSVTQVWAAKGESPHCVVHVVPM